MGGFINTHCYAERCGRFDRTLLRIREGQDSNHGMETDFPG
jgi:hypothetical protein